MEVDAPLGGEGRVAFCGLFEGVEGDEGGGARGGFVFGGVQEGGLLCFTPGAEAGEAVAHLLGLSFEVG